MTTRPEARLLFAAVTLFWQVACSTSGTPTDAREPLIRTAQDSDFDPEPTPAGPTLDELFLKVGERIPGFGGLGIGPDGILEISLVDTTDGARVRSAVSEVFSGSKALKGRASRLIPVRYSFAQLVSWRTKLYDAGLPKGVRQVDADERGNVLAIGISDGQASLAVLAIARNLAIPEDALIVTTVDAPRPLTDSLGNYLRPITGGLIHGLWLNPSSVNYCSVGFKAKKAGTTRYFVTNAHCTAAFGSVSGDSVGQPNNSYRIGNEIQDPSFTSTNCDAGYLCRWSDAALIQCASISPCSAYTIARTTSEYTGSNWSTGAGSLELTGDYWYVVGELSNSSLVYGATVSRVGFGSGWTGGTIQKTCSDYVNYPTSGNILKCQFTSLAVVRSGDSGSPVFQYDSDTGGAWLGGVIWGYEYDAVYQSIFSPLDGVKTDLGSMTAWSPIY